MSSIVPSRQMSVGTHLIVNLYDISDTDLLSYMWRCNPILSNIVNELNLTVVNEAGHQFQPIGYTFAYVLSESHLTIHTYPEHSSCYIDIFCCNPDFNPMKAITLLKQLFNTDNVKYNIITR
jgi:S-adenosylmethionine decarboxylase